MITEMLVSEKKPVPKRAPDTAYFIIESFLISDNKVTRLESKSSVRDNKPTFSKTVFSVEADSGNFTEVTCSENLESSQYYSEVADLSPKIMEEKVRSEFAGQGYIAVVDDYKNSRVAEVSVDEGSGMAPQDVLHIVFDCGPGECEPNDKVKFIEQLYLDAAKNESQSRDMSRYFDESESLALSNGNLTNYAILEEEQN